MPTNNGELYDYQRIRADLTATGARFQTKSDSEIILHLYPRHGLDELWIALAFDQIAQEQESERSGAGALLLLTNWRRDAEEQTESVHQSFGEVEWVTIFFFVGLFIVVSGIEPRYPFGVVAANVPHAPAAIARQGREVVDERRG